MNVNPEHVVAKHYAVEEPESPKDRTKAGIANNKKEYSVLREYKGGAGEKGNEGEDL